MLTRLTLICTLLLLPALLLAQGTGKVKGTVTDQATSETLIGASVSIEGTSLGAATDIDGNYVILNVPAGTHTLRASYVGYQVVAISNILVNSGLTTELNFGLTSEELQLQPVEIVAERPLVNKSATNAVRITTSEDIQNIALRGVNQIIALSPGVVLQDNTVFIRGGRQDEVGFYLEGVPITNKFVGGRAVTLVQDAIEEIQVQAGGYNAEFGGANSGIIQTQLRSGTSDWKASAQYLSDNIGFKSTDGLHKSEKTLGTYSYGFNEFTGTVSGPLANEKIKLFGLFNYLFNEDQTPQPFPGINLGVISDPVTGDSINLQYPAGPVYGNSLEQFTYTGTLSFDLKPVQLRLGGTYTSGTSFNAFSAARVAGNIANILNTERIDKVETGNGAFNLKITHLIDPNTYYDVNIGYFRQTANTFDPLLGDDFLHYGDSAANAALGVTNFAGAYLRPTRINIFTFSFNQPGDVVADYIKFKRENVSLSAGLTSQQNQHSIKVGGEYQRYAMRNYSFGNEGAFALAGLIAVNDALAATDPNKLTLEQILKRRGVNNFGYDVFGEENDEGGSLFSLFDVYPDGGLSRAKYPVFAALYLQDKIEFKDLVLNLGLRYDYINSDSYAFIDPEHPELAINKTTNEYDPAGLFRVAPYKAVSPRIGMAFPVTDRTVFHAQFGKFVQQSRLRDVYQGYYATGANLGGGFFIPAPVGFDVRPTRTTQYEIGFTQQISDFASFDITGYYKDIQDQIVYDQQNVGTGSPFGSYFILRNGDFATTKGVELTFNMRRTKRVQMNANLSFNDAQGTGSFPNSNRGVVGAPLDGVTVFKPQYVTPLEYNNSIRGSVNLDYHFGKNDGPTALQQFGASFLLTFNSGHPFTKGIGGADLEGDARDRQPTQPLNSSSTPWYFQADLRVDKSFNIMEKLNATIYFLVTNLFDTKNVTNVFLRTGTADDDGYLSTPELGGQLVQLYGQDYADMYRAINIDYYEQYQNAGGLNTAPLFYGPPRQIRFGIRLDY
ncbi:MAG TPA: TonB-dependent receptor [Bacteroidota bacterium]|nr:TonB-dependent receptor [Bacteroidota bacterium]